jgi:hypothetical protein
MCMPDHVSRADLRPTCPQCKAAQMTEVVAIPSVLDEAGLIAYECPRCGYVTSVLVPAGDAHSG